MVGMAVADSRTHCKSGETDFFTCTIAGSNKVVSLCGDRNEETRVISWLQYRFGLIGHPEMIYPTVMQGSVDKFYGRHQTSHGSSYYQYDIWFHIGDYNYSVSASSTGDESGEVPKEISAYVYYQKVNRKVNRSANSGPIVLQGSLMCSQPSEKLIDRLGALFPYLQPEPEIEN